MHVLSVVHTPRRTKKIGRKRETFFCSYFFLLFISEQRVEGEKEEKPFCERTRKRYLLEFYPKTSSIEKQVQYVNKKKKNEGERERDRGLARLC